MNAESYSSKFDFNKFKIVSEPFPHAVVDNFFDPQFYQELKAQLPSIETYTKLGDQARIDLQKGQRQFEEFISSSPAWTRLYKEMESQDFTAGFLKELSPLLKEYGVLNLDTQKARIVDFDEVRHFEANVLVRAQRKAIRMMGIEPWFRKNISANVNKLKNQHHYFNCFHVGYSKSGYKVRPHTDNRQKLLVCLVYFDTLPENAGELHLHRRTDEVKLNECARYPKPDQLEVFQKIQVKENRAVLFVNSNNAYHSAEGWNDPLPRRLFYFSIARKNAENSWDTSFKCVSNEPEPASDYDN